MQDRLKVFEQPGGSGRLKLTNLELPAWNCAELWEFAVYINRKYIHTQVLKTL